MWGGHPEIRALACSLGLTVVVYGANHAPITISPDTADKPSSFGSFSTNEYCLRLSFHTHYYALGEHYNSVVKAL